MNTTYIFNEIFMRDIQDQINIHNVPLSLVTSSIFHTKSKFQSPRSPQKEKNKQKTQNNSQSKNLNQLLQKQFYHKIRQHRNRRITDHCESIFYKRCRQSPQSRYKRKSLKQYIDSQSQVLLQDLLRKNKEISPSQQKQILKMKQQRLKNLEKIFHNSEVDLDHNFTGKSYLRKIIQQKKKSQSETKTKSNLYKFILAKTTKNNSPQHQKAFISQNRIHFNSFDSQKSSQNKKVQIKFRKTMLNFQKQATEKQAQTLEESNNKVVSLKKKLIMRQNKQKQKVFQKQKSFEPPSIQFKIAKFEPKSLKQKTDPAITLNQFFKIQEQENDRILPWKRKKQEEQITSFFDYHL